MTPIKTPSTNKILGRPADWDDEAYGTCAGLPITECTDLDGKNPVMYSYWTLAWKERLAVLFGYPVRLAVCGNGHPAVMLDTET